MADSSTDKPVDLYVNEIPGYPEGLHIYPENYTIHLSKDQYFPIKDLAANGGKFPNDPREQDK